MDTFGDVNFSGLAKDLLNKLRFKDITLPDLLRDCAFWACRDGFEELRPKPLPTAPRTPAFSEFEGLTPDKKQKVDPQFFIKNPEVNAYYAQVLFVRNHNRAIYEWLKEVRGYLPAEDLVLQNKVSNRLNEFDNFINAENDLIDRAKEIFEGAEV